MSVTDYVQAFSNLVGANNGGTNDYELQFRYWSEEKSAKYAKPTKRVSTGAACQRTPAANGVTAYEFTIKKGMTKGKLKGCNPRNLATYYSDDEDYDEDDVKALLSRTGNKAPRGQRPRKVYGRLNLPRGDDDDTDDDEEPPRVVAIPQFHAAPFTEVVPNQIVAPNLLAGEITEEKFWSIIPAFMSNGAPIPKHRMRMIIAGEDKFIKKYLEVRDETERILSGEDFDINYDPLTKTQLADYLILGGREQHNTLIADPEHLSAVIISGALFAPDMPW